MDKCPQPGIAQRLGELRRTPLRGIALVNQIDLAFGRGLARRILLPEIEQAFHADGETHRRRGLAAQQFDQAVVAAAAADSPLGPSRSVTHSKTVRL